MADKLFKKGEVIEFGYQAPNAESGLTEVVAEIFLPGRVKDSGHPDVLLVEVPDTGTYRGEFTPDELGVWQVIIHKAGILSKEGQVIKAYSVGNYNLNEIGVAVEAVQAAIDAFGDVATDEDVVTARNVVTNAIDALIDIDAAGVQAAAAAAIATAEIATPTNVSDVQDALTTLINALPSAAAIETIVTDAIVAAGLATAVAVADVKTVVDNINDKVSALDTPPMAF